MSSKTLKLSTNILKNNPQKNGGEMRPCVIAEPFFIDNDNDLRVANKHYDALVVAYADAIEEIAESAVCEVTYQPEGESDA